MAVLHENQLILDRCPHCNVDMPTLVHIQHFRTTDYQGANRREWGVFKCSRCGSVITAATPKLGTEITEIYPSTVVIDDSIPARAKEYLKQALNSQTSPVGAVILSASAVDAMLKIKGYRDGSLYSRIDKAAADHVITPEMALWAHEIRLEANDQRHADEDAPLPEITDAKRAIEFALALGQFMFVLPARVQRGIVDAKGER
ncbi:MAG: DUF4145 domain-containing protein [Candidatus Zixiibacteriota bacterium]|nr:MAG: DUF4145 domain-containing protein [candidate division Zixibacteria bacterium]